MMKFILLGSGGAIPDAERGSPGQVVVVNSEPLLIDCGPGASIRLLQAGIGLAKLNRILLTHYHIDHCIEYPSVILSAYLMGKRGGFSLYGPEGLTHLNSLMFQDAFPYVQSLVRAVMRTEVEVETKEVAAGVVLKTDQFTIKASPVSHGPISTLAYRIDSDAGSIVISGDTSPCDSLVELAKDVNVLVQDCAFPDHRGEVPGHSIPRQVGEIARKARVKKVVLTHLFPECRGFEGQMIASIKQTFDGDAVVGNDLMTIEL